MAIPASKTAPLPYFVSALLVAISILANHASAQNVSSSDAIGTYSRKNPEYLRLFVEETSWYNDIVLGPILSQSLRSGIPHFFQTWLRNYIAGVFLYLVSGGLWCLYIYRWKSQVYFPTGEYPSFGPIWLQIQVSMKAMPLYTLLPTISEYMVENGWTKCYSQVKEVGYLNYTIYCTIYFVLVEFGIYWMHRGLHDIKPLYTYLHATHHIYNKQNTLSPFAGLAFHPIDGILQAIPHVISLFLVPMHLFSHEIALFMEGIWTTNIHDCIDGQVWPVMGAAYHTIHHTTYRHNYGHYTIWMDWMFKTLKDPLGKQVLRILRRANCCDYEYPHEYLNDYTFGACRPEHDCIGPSLHN